jgi:hypothetical protein
MSDGVRYVQPINCTTALEPDGLSDMSDRSPLEISDSRTFPAQVGYVQPGACSMDLESNGHVRWGRIYPTHGLHHDFGTQWVARYVRPGTCFMTL